MNAAIAKILYELSVLYELKGVAFKPRALERASMVIADLSEDIRVIYKRDGLGGLEDIPGIGSGIAERIEEYIKTRHIKEHDRMKKKLPVDIADIIEVEGIGPKTLQLLYNKLGIRTKAQLIKAARGGKLAAVRGIGVKGQERILRNIEYQPTAEWARFLPGAIWPKLRPIVDEIGSWPHVKRLELVGSLRRMQETIGDLDMLALSDDSEDTLRRFVSLSHVKSVYAHGEHNALVRLKLGMDSDIWVMPEESYGAALIAWTGNKAHNIHLRALAKKKGFLLSDFGLFKGTKMIAGRTEEEVYAKLGLPWIPPELRSDNGEIEAAAEGGLPQLVGYSDIKGDLHMHSDWTDGSVSILAMAQAAQSVGLEYIAITDHTKSLAIAHGLDAQQLKKQWAEIDNVQKKVPKVKLLKGTECDILKDGRLDLPDAALSQLDVVNASVHSHFNMSVSAQTDRVARAMESKHVDIISHMTGRIIQRREPYDLDMEKLFKEAKRTKTVLEVNAQPWRLDLKDEYIRKTVEAGIFLSIGTDSHSPDDMNFMRWGVGQARRGWATKKSIINTRPWREMLKLLK